MLELLHAVIASLLLSTAMGGGVDRGANADEEPGNSETGVEVGKMPAHLLSPRGLTGEDQGDDHQPTALAEHCAFCEPAVVSEQPIVSLQCTDPSVCFRASGRSP